MTQPEIRLLRAVLRSLDSLKASLDKHSEAIGEQTQATKEENREKPPVQLRSALRLPVSVRRYYEAEQRERQAAWRKIRSGLEYVGIFSAVSLAVLTWFTLRRISSQAESAREQVGIMQRQLEATDRPWIKIAAAVPTEDMTFSWSIIDGRRVGRFAGTRVSIVVKNIGRSVALDVSIHGKMTFIEDVDQLKTEQARICSGVTQTVPLSTLTMFPDEDSAGYFFVLGAADVPPKSHELSLSAGEVPWKHDDNTWLAAPKILGCVSYAIPSTHERRRSEFLYAIEHIDTTQPSSNSHWRIPYFDVSQEVVPIKDLSLDPYTFGFDAN